MTVLALAQLQRQFLARMRGLPATDVLSQIGNGQMPRDTGLGIYCHAYGARLREALGNDHAVLGVYLGDDRWEILCAGYIDAHPSRQASLRHFGNALPWYLAQAREFSRHPQIAELAGLERSLLDSFDAADSERADWQQLLATEPASWPGLQLRFHPSLMLHHVAFNSVEIWKALKEERAPPLLATAISKGWAIWRDDQRITRLRSLDEEESAALAHFLKGGDFAGLCDLLLAWHPMPSVPEAALGHLRCWCAQGWVSRWA